MSSVPIKNDDFCPTLPWDEDSQVRRRDRSSVVPVTQQLRDTLVDDDTPQDQLKGQALARIGTVLGSRWELRNLLGCGSAGAVYSAVDLERDERAAIKVLHPGLDQSREHVLRFEREAHTAASIGHSSVVKVLEVDRDDEHGCLFMVLELLEGEALFHAIEARRLETGDIVEIGRQLLGALAAAHARGIIHRDVKPENLFLVHERSGALRLKLLDFGIAKVLQNDGSSLRTLDGMLMGTPHYMSPEVCKGEPADPKADLWAAAAVLYHAFSGEPPFDGRSIGELLTKIVTARAPSLGELRPDLPRSLVATIDRALDPDSSRRWKSALAFSDALTVGGALIEGLDWDDY